MSLMTIEEANDMLDNDFDYDSAELGFFMLAGTGAGNAGTDVLYRLQEGVERFMITDINSPGASNLSQSILPIMWDTISSKPAGGIGYNHVPGGCNTLFLDGHVEFIRYGDEFPATRAHAQYNSLFE